MSELTCEIIRDLLPSYVDGLTSEMTNTAVEEHICTCDNCRDILQKMKTPDTSLEPSGMSDEDQKKEINFLKKVNNRNKLSLIFCFLGTFLLVLLIFYTRFFLLGDHTSVRSIIYNTQVEGKQIDFRGKYTDSTLGFARASFEEGEGTVTIRVYSTLKNILNKSEINASYTAKSDFDRIKLGDLIIWENGVSIAPKVSGVFAVTNPYVGDMPSNGRIANQLGIGLQFGEYTNELQTSNEPYGWALILENQISSENETIAMEMMKEDSYVLLAAVGNLGYVEWQFDTEEGPGSLVVTADQATEYFGSDIKGCGEDICKMQELMDSLLLVGQKFTLIE